MSKATGILLFALTVMAVIAADKYLGATDKALAAVGK